LTGALAILLVWTGTLDQLVTYSSVVVFVFYAMSGVAVYLFRRRTDLPPAQWKVWGYPATPAVFALLCIAFAGNACWGEPKEALLGFAAAALGWPLYRLSQRMGRQKTLEKTA
jgi:amino acid transporter